jgi:chromosome segregation ATPase
MAASDVKTVPAPAIDEKPSKGEIEIKALLERMDAAADRRDRAYIERFAKADRDIEALTKAVTKVVEDQVSANTRLGNLESEREGMRAAMTSQHEIELGLREDLRSLGDELKGHLVRQDEAAKKAAEEAKEEAERRERVKREAREQESIAAKNVEAARAHSEKMFATRVPIILGAIGLVGTLATVAASVYTQARMHDDFAEQLRAHDLRTLPTTK